MQIKYDICRNKNDFFILEVGKRRSQDWKIIFLHSLIFRLLALTQSLELKSIVESNLKVKIEKLA